MLQTISCLYQIADVFAFVVLAAAGRSCWASTRPPLPVGRLHDRQHAPQLERAPLHRLGPVHRFGLDGPAGGRKDPTATMVGTFLVLWLFQSLIVISQQYALIFIGALLLVTILFTTGGYLVWLMEHWDAYTQRRRERAAPLPSSRPMAEGAAE